MAVRCGVPARGRLGCRVGAGTASAAGIAEEDHLGAGAGGGAGVDHRDAPVEPCAVDQQAPAGPGARAVEALARHAHGRLDPPPGLRREQLHPEQPRLTAIDGTPEAARGALTRCVSRSTERVAWAGRSLRSVLSSESASRSAKPMNAQTAPTTMAVGVFSRSPLSGARAAYLSASGRREVSDSPRPAQRAEAGDMRICAAAE